MAPRKARQARKTPTTSPAVSLPTETLARILELVVEDLEDSEPFTAQLYRLRFAKVCRHWCTVALPLDVYVVGSSQRAQKLAKVLEARPVGERPTSLDITVEPTGSKSARAGRVAALLRACPRLTTLRLDVSATLGVKRYDDLGEPVRAALMTLRHLVSLELFGCALAARHSWSALFASWPKLSTLRVSERLWDRFGWYGPSPQLPALQEFAVSLGNTLPGDLLQAMSSSSKNTLNALHLDGIVYSVIPDLKTLLTPVLGRITELHAMEASHQLSRQQLNVGSFKGVLGELSSVRSLELGSNLVNFSVLFGDVLLSLPTLRHLVVVATRRLYHNDVIQQASQGDILGYLAQAPAAFKSLGMDAELVHHWSAQEHERVAEAAAAGGVAWEVLA